MKKLTTLLVGVASVAVLSVSALSGADAKKPKPYPLTTCAVTDEKIDPNSGMTPYSFTHKDREIRLCCKGCLKDFNKDAAKYVAKIEAAEKKAK